MPTHNRAKTVKSTTSLIGVGIIHVILTIGMERWIHENSLRKFLGLRYTEEYSQFLHGLQGHINKSNKFKIDQETTRLEQIGNDLGVFRTYVYENLFMPTFVMTDSTLPIPKSLEGNNEKIGAFHKQWEAWPVKKIRISRGGTITVKLEQPIDRDTPLVDMAEIVLGLEKVEQEKARSELNAALADEQEFSRWVKRYTPLRLKPSGIQWIMADEVVRQFLTEIHIDEQDRTKAKENAIQRHKHLKKINVEDGALVWNDQKHSERSFFLNVNLPGAETSSLRDRYVVFAFSKLADPKNPNAALKPDTIKQSSIYCKNISSLLEGVAVKQKGAKTEFAKYKEEMGVNLVEKGDLATWENELCLLTLDNALVYYTEHSKIYFFNRDVEHEEYWGSIVRGIEHLMEVRVQTQMVARETSEKLAHAAEFTRILSDPETLAQSNNKNRIDSVEQQIRRFAVDTSYLARMSGYLRNWSSPVSMSKADFAVIKFKYWLQASDIDKMLDSTDKNMRDINAFLSHYDDIQIQSDSQSTNDLTLIMTVAFSAIMVFLSVLSLPSFVADLGRSEIPKIFFWFTVPISQFFADFGILIVLTSFLGVFIAGVLSAIRIWKKRKRRRRPFLG